jgi:hypothetical protein
VPPLDHADPAFTSRPPLLAPLEPALFLQLAPFDAAGAAVGNERKVLEQMRTLRTDGVSFNQIAARLNEQPVPPRSGQCWHAFTVSKILARNVKSATGS